MVIVTIIRWKEKLLFALVGILIIAGISLGLSVVVPSGKLDEDVYTQPVKVQGDINVDNVIGN